MLIMSRTWSFRWDWFIQRETRQNRKWYHRGLWQKGIRYFHNIRRKKKNTHFPWKSKIIL